MKTALRIFLGLWLVTLFASEAAAKGWRGIVPLRSTREDVTRLLGPSPDANKIRANYRLKGEDVYIVFASDESYFDECVRRLPAGTVMQIRVTPKREVTLSDFRLEESRVERFDPSDPPGAGFRAYLDDEEGLIVLTYKGRVNQAVYIASAADRHRCPAYYRDRKSFVSINADPPALSLDCPPGSPKAGDRITFTANLSGADPDRKPTYKWEISGGLIVKGQGTGSITVDTRGMAGKTVRATVEVGGAAEGFTNKESCEVRIAPAHRSVRRPRRRR